MDPAPNVQSKSNELLMAAGQGDVEQIKLLLQQHKEEDVARQGQVVLHVENGEDVVDGQGPAVAIAEAATATGNSILHVVAGGGGAARFLESATVIVGMANHLLGARNGKGDTPLHCAARLGHASMVSHLLDLASSAGDGGERVKAILRTQNGKGETVLHEAIRLEDKDMAGVLLSADSQLARVPLADGASPLYLALLLGLGDIARQLFEGDEALSYSGPDGQNAFHAAILGTRGKGATRVMKMLLERNKDLVKQADRSTGSTPLHLAATWRRRGWMVLLLKAGPAAAYLPDNNGSFPTHLAAFEGDGNAVSALLEESGPYCAELRDGKGRTFLHVAAEAEESISVVKLACRWQGKLFASSVMNMQDDDGNTALHLAVLAGNIRAVSDLVSIPEVKLYVSNNKRQTPLETAYMTAYITEYSAWSAFYGNPRRRIYIMLIDARDWTGVSAGITLSGREQREFKSALAEMNRSQNIAGQTQIIGLGSALITTVTFAAAFAVPGGYRADDHRKGGTPTLAGHYSFDAFVIANTLAFICSLLSILFLMYAGVGTNVKNRMRPLLISVYFLASSGRSLGAAFALGMYSILAPVERTKALYSCMITVFPLVLVELFLSIRTVLMSYSDNRAVMARMFASQVSWWTLAHGVLICLMVLVGLIVIGQYWQYILIAAMSH